MLKQWKQYMMDDDIADEPFFAKKVFCYNCAKLPYQYEDESVYRQTTTHESRKAGKKAFKAELAKCGELLTMFTSSVKPEIFMKGPQAPPKVFMKGPRRSASPPAKRSASPRGCSNQSHLKKYRERPGPPYPANECCGARKVGNDGLMYESVRNAAGICAWRKIKA